jgi:glycosyltransferase involved in cell wall biosynthesis
MEKGHIRTTAPTIGVAAICFDEERDIAPFLEHLLRWVDEIVIVDDGSKDRTAAVAAGCDERVKFVTSPRDIDEGFCDQRNKAIAVAQSDWLLHMDIDERVPPELATEIKSAVQNPSFDGYRFRRLNFFLHRPIRGGEWGDWNHVHLARRGVHQFTGKVHEACRVDVAPERIGQLQGFMWHLNDADYHERIRKSDSYCRWEAYQIIRTGKTVRWYHLLGAPLRRFMVLYVAKMGFRDGAVGLLAALHSASAEFRSRALVWDQQNRIERETIEGQIAELWAGSLPHETGPHHPRSPEALRGSSENRTE